MEGNQTKNIEKSLNALRVIKHTVYSKRFYPGNFDTDFWEEKDFEDSSFRKSMRAEFERYIELYVELNNKHVIALQESAPERILQRCSRWEASPSTTPTPTRLLKARGSDRA